MDRNDVEKLATELLGGKLPLADFLARLTLPGPPKTADLGEAQIDLDRGRRCGFPEVVFGEGKTVATLEKIFSRLLAEGIEVFATRVSADKAAELRDKFPAAMYNPLARTLRISPENARLAAAIGGTSQSTPHPSPLTPHSPPRVAVVTAGTGDLPVAEEARETLLWMGVEVVLIQDVGVAGPHRLRERLPDLENADAVVVVAGMEGALPSVVGGYVACPVIGVPTSIGYGASFGGLAALLSMLNSCAANVTVVNIDAGFKAGYVAGMIARRGEKEKGRKGD